MGGNPQRAQSGLPRERRGPVLLFRRLWMRYMRRAALAAQVLQLSMPVSWRGSGQPPELPDTYSTYVSDLRSL